MRLVEAEGNPALSELPTVDPIHAAGGCYCRECKYHKPIDYCALHRSTGWFGDKWCCRGKLREAQDDG